MPDREAISKAHFQKGSELITKHDREKAYQASYKKGIGLIQKYMHLHDEVSFNSLDMEAEVENGIQHLKYALKLFPQMWPCWWVIGKGHQRLGHHEAAYGAFMESLKLNPGHPESLNELALECLETHRHEEALACNKAAFAADPLPGYRCNIALCHLLLGDNELAEREANQACYEDPDDKMSQAMLSCIRAVITGKAPQPVVISEVYEIPALIGVHPWGLF